MKSTNGLTQTAQTSGGVLFTSWLEKDSNGPIMARSDDTLPSSLSNDQDFNDISTDEIIDGEHYHSGAEEVGGQGGRTKSIETLVFVSLF